VVLYSLMPEHGVGELVHALVLHHLPGQLHWEGEDNGVIPLRADRAQGLKLTQGSHATDRLI
jgi:hypothetical protein